MLMDCVEGVLAFFSSGEELLPPNDFTFCGGLPPDSRSGIRDLLVLCGLRFGCEGLVPGVGAGVFVGVDGGDVEVEPSEE